MSIGRLFDRDRKGYWPSFGGQLKTMSKLQKNYKNVLKCSCAGGFSINTATRLSAWWTNFIA